LSMMLHRKMPLYSLFWARFHIPSFSFPYRLCWTHDPRVISHHLSPHHQEPIWSKLVSHIPLQTRWPHIPWSLRGN
jgi:hypothetical protein